MPKTKTLCPLYSIMQGVSVLVLVALVACASSLPVKQTPWERSGKYQGDILLHPSQLDKNGMTDSRYYWPGGIMYFSISDSFNDNDRNVIYGAVNEYNTRTCVRLIERTDQQNYVQIGNSQAGCYAYVGMIGGGQELNLGNGCIWHGTIVHEMLHALGFWHQQSASDRDDWVTIMWQNIEAGQEHNFDKYDSNTVTDFGVQYDYGSVMHYGPTAFSSNGQPTIVPHDPNANIGQSDGLSDSDILKLNRMYQC